MAKFYLNDEARDLQGEKNLEEILTSELESTKGIAIAINGTLVPRSSWQETIISENTRILVVTAAQGG